MARITKGIIAREQILRLRKDVSRIAELTKKLEKLGYKPKGEYSFPPIDTIGR